MYEKIGIKNQQLIFKTDQLISQNAIEHYTNITKSPMKYLFFIICNYYRE